MNGSKKPTQVNSNLYLRNVLFRILSDTPRLTKFHEMIGSVFPGLVISSNFDPNNHLHIDLSVELDGRALPIEMVGTGCLQAIQLVAYVTAYNPELLLLDEPDAHLHPSNQKLLALTLQKIADSGQTKVILATHSRHIFDALVHDEKTQIVWLKEGGKQPESDKSNLSVLMDLGALDSFELFHAGMQRLVILTEDSKVARLRVFLRANGLQDDEYFLQPLHGVSNLSAAVPIADFFTRQAENTFVVVHRDGDCMRTEEKDWWIENESKKLPERTSVFVTPLTDVEHSFCRPEHIAAVYEIPLPEAQAMVHAVITANVAKFAAEFAQKRSELKANALRKMEDVPSAVDLMAGGVQFDQVRGKSLLPLVLDALQQGGHNPMRLTMVVSEHLVHEALRDRLAKVKASSATLDANLPGAVQPISA